MRKPIRLLVTGGRKYEDKAFVFRILDLILFHRDLECIIHGAAKTGADKFAHEWCELRGVPEIAEPADWITYGKAAGVLRNEDMLRRHAPHAIVAFPGGNGTRDMINRGRRDGITVWEPSRRIVHVKDKGLFG